MKTTTAVTLAGALASVASLSVGVGASSGANRPAAREATIPSGTVLRVGEQLKNLSTVLDPRARGQNLPYQVQYSEFVGGPPMLQAFEGGALDVGFIQSTPLIFAQAAGQHVAAVAGWASSGQRLRAWSRPPGNTPSGPGPDLKGKRVAFQQGTALESALLEGLKSAGLNLSDITPVNVPATQVAAALQGGSADAGIEVEPLLSVYLQANPTAQVIARPAAVTEKSDFLGRHVVRRWRTRASRPPWPTTSPVSSRRTSTSAPTRRRPSRRSTRASTASSRRGPPYVGQARRRRRSSSALPGTILAAQQNLANLYLAAGSIPAARQRDTRSSTPASTPSSRRPRRHDDLAHRDAVVAPPGAQAPASSTGPTARHPPWFASRRRRRRGPPAAGSAAPPGPSRLIGVALLVAVWEIASLLGWIQPQDLAAPTAVLSTGAHLLANGTLQSALWASLQRVFWGLAIGVPIGAALALAAGLSRLGRTPHRRQRPGAAVRPHHRARVAVRPVARRRRDGEDLA